MARNAYRMDHKGFAEMARQSGIGDAMVDAAEAGKQWAERNAPTRSGEYAGSFETGRADVPGGRNNETRAGAYLANTARHAGVVEHQSRILRRAVDVIEEAP